MCCCVVDWLGLALEFVPGLRISLDAVCRRFSIDISQRVLHGALLDAEILSDVYLLLTGGQGGLFDVAEETKSEDHVDKVISESATSSRSLSGFLEVKASESEVREHEEFLSFIEERNSNASIWRSSSEPD